MAHLAHNLRLDPDSAVPLYAQLAQHLRLEIARGRLTAGDPLPTVRQLAVDLRINMHTVAHAYAELAQEGLIVTRRGVGTCVQGPPEPPAADERDRRLRQIMHEAVGQAAALGLTPAQLARELATYVATQESPEGTEAPTGGE